MLIAGRPVSRVLDNGLTLEILRTCAPAPRPRLANGHADPALSMLIGASLRAAWALGYRKVISYTQGEETGSTYRACGFTLEEELAARGSWAESSVKLAHIRDAQGTGGVPRRRWAATKPGGRT